MNLVVSFVDMWNLFNRMHQVLLNSIGAITVLIKIDDSSDSDQNKGYFVESTLKKGWHHSNGSADRGR